MKNFVFYNPARIIFGKGVEEKTGEQVLKYGKKVLLHYGGGTIKKIGLYDKIIQSLNNSGIEIFELGGAKPNPRLSLVYEGIKICKENNIDFILSVGGGSTIDSAKSIAVGAVHDNDVWDFYSKGISIKKALPIGVVLTIPASGSEASPNAVLTKEDESLKRAIGSEVIIPKFAIMNPEYTCSLPTYQTACGASDILAHLMERYFTQVDNVDFTDRMIEASMRTIINNGLIAIKEPNNYDVRAEVMWVGTIAHNGLLGTGRVECWGSHAIEHEVSAYNDVAHGAGLSVIFPAWMKYVYKDNIDRFVQFAMRVFDVDFAMNKREEIVLEGINRLEQWYKALGLPIKLSEIGVTESAIRDMAEKAVFDRADKTLGNFKKLTADDIFEIYKLAL